MPVTIRCYNAFCNETNIERKLKSHAKDIPGQSSSLSSINQVEGKPSTLRESSRRSKKQKTRILPANICRICHEEKQYYTCNGVTEESHMTAAETENGGMSYENIKYESSVIVL